MSWFFEKDSLERGEVKLTFLKEFYLGIENFLLVLFIGSISGIVYADLRKASPASTRDGFIPFVLFLAAGACAIIFFSSELISD